jgi:hypothetical protein
VRELVSPTFRERLMMVVTEVNGFRYCGSYHSRQDLSSNRNYLPENTRRDPVFYSRVATNYLLLD